MSIKTLRKRIALVAVASLGFGLMSVVPASAAAQDGPELTAINVKAATANTNEASSEISVFVGGTATGTDLDATETINFAAALTTFPTGGFVAVEGQTGEASLNFTAAAGTDTGSTNKVVYAATVDATGGATTVSATGTNGLVKFSFTPTVSGAYVVTFWNDVDDDGSLDLTEARQTLSITVTARGGVSTGTSTVFQTLTTGAAATSTTDRVPARVSKSLGTAAVAAITINAKNAAGTTLATADDYTLNAAVISGVGGVGATLEFAANPTFAAQCPGTQPVRVATSATYTGVAQVYFCASNQSGTSTIEISVTDADGLTTILGTETITYYGDVVKLEVVPVLTIGDDVAGTNGDNTATRIATTAPPAAIVKATDASGNLVGGLSLSATPNDKIASASCNMDVYDTGTSGAYGSGGTGFYNCQYVSTPSAASGDSGSLIFRVVDPTDATKYITAAPMAVKFGGSPSTVTMSFDKASYKPGEAATLTVSVVDSKGNPTEDQVLATLFEGASVTNIQGSVPGAAVVIIGGKKTYSVFMPNGAGTASVSNTIGASIAAKAGQAVSATATVVDPVDAQIASLVAAIAKLQKAINKINKRLAR